MLAALALSVPASAQSPQRSPLEWKSPDGALTITPGIYFQADGRDYFRNPDAPSQFFIRRLRPSVDVQIWQAITGRVLLDFAGNQARIFDAYADVAPFPELGLRVGKMKVPLGLERLQSDATGLLLAERGLPSGINPDRDFGVELYGAPLGGRAQYSLAVMNAVPDGTLVDYPILTGHLELMARLLLQPFKGESLPALAGLSFGAGASTGVHNGTPQVTLLPVYRTVGQIAFFKFAGAPSETSPTPSPGAAFADGRVERLTPQGYWHWGPAAALVEYAWSSQEVTHGSTHGTVIAHAWQVAAGYVLTGADVHPTGVVVEHPFDLKHGTWGEVQLSARVTQMQISRSAFTLGLAEASSASGALSESIAVHWFINRWLLLLVEYDRTDFDPGYDSRRPENLLLGRVQLAL